ncbi:MAG: polyprenyl diphosphate synthase, partial [Planctomycetota bacterium]
AAQRKLSRIKGHEKGAQSVQKIVRACAEIGIKHLTLYAFSKENWKRPSYEINFLMRMLKRYLIKQRKELMKNNIIFKAIGRIAELPPGVQKELAQTVQVSAGNTGLVLCLALNYGGRTEIVDAARRLAADVKNNVLDINDITEEKLAGYLYDPAIPDPDLLIRTAGELRVSNFLLWQISYTEFWVTPVLWPDFDKEHLYQAIRDYAGRERRFGGLEKQDK